MNAAGNCPWGGECRRERERKDNIWRIKAHETLESAGSRMMGKKAWGRHFVHKNRSLNSERMVEHWIEWNGKLGSDSDVNNCVGFAWAEANLSATPWIGVGMKERRRERRTQNSQDWEREYGAEILSGNTLTETHKQEHKGFHYMKSNIEINLTEFTIKPAKYRDMRKRKRKGQFEQRNSQTQPGFILLFLILDDKQRTEN